MSKPIYRDASGNEYELPDGEKVTWRISVYGVVMKGTKLLMVMPDFNPQWQFPGGGVEHTETIPEALKREFKEEVGYLVEVESRDPLYLNEANFYNAGNKTYYHSLQFLFKATLIDEEQKTELISEADKDGIITWKEIDELKEEDVQHTHWPVIEILKKQLS